MGTKRERSLHTDSRGVSTAVTHALTLAITATLLIGLVGAAGSFLSDQEDLAAREEVDTVGNRLTGQIEKVSNLAQERGSATIYVSRPESIVGSNYQIQLRSGSDCDSDRFDTDQCLVITLSDRELTGKFPVNPPSNVNFSISASSDQVVSVTASLNTSKTAVTAQRRSLRRSLTRSLRVGVGGEIDRNPYGKVLNPRNRIPIAKFTIRPNFPDSSDTIRTDAAESRDPDGSIVAYRWYVDGSQVGGNSPTLSQPLPPGQHNVTLEVEDDEGSTANRTRSVRVSGLEYNDDMSVSAGSNRAGGNCASHSLTNQWGDTIKITHMSIDPPNKVNKIEYNSGPEIAIDTDSDSFYEYTYDTGTLDTKNKEDGVVVRLRADGSPVTLSPGQTMDVSVCKFKGGGPLQGQGDFPEFGHRYWEDGVTNRTVVGGSVGIFDYSVDGSSGDVTVSFKSPQQLDRSTFDGEVGGGGSSTPLTGASFSETDLGTEWEYEATFTRSPGTHYVNLTDAETSTGTSVSGLPKNDTASLFNPSSAYVWDTDSDWDGASTSVGVVHDSYGDYVADTVQLGRPPGSVDSSLVSYWPFDGGSAVDVHGSNDGAIQGSPGTATGIAGTTALRFDGSDDHVVVPHDPSLEMSDDDEVTVSMWVNKHREGGNQWRALLQKSDESYNMQFEDGFNFEFTINDGSWHSPSEEALDYTTNEYYHVVGVFDGVEIEHYVDGTLIDTNSNANAISDASSWDIGIAENLDASGRHTNADIDDVRIYDDPLSGDQVEQLHNVTEGTLVTDKRSGTTIDGQKADLTYDADIPSGTQIELTVYGEWTNAGGKTKTTQSDTITLQPADSGRQTVDVTGLKNKNIDTFWVEADLSSSSPKGSPTLTGIELKEGS